MVYRDETSRVLSIRCRECGAHWVLSREDGDEDDVCPYCEGPIEVPLELEEDLIELEELADEVHDEGVRVIAAAVAQAAQPGAMFNTGWAMAVVSGSLLSAFTLGLLTSSFVVGVGGFLGGFLIFAIGVSAILNAKRHRDYEAAKERAWAAIEDWAREAYCPNCGDEVEVPPGAVAIECPSCEAHLLAAEGLLIERYEEAEDRVEEWEARARYILEGIEERDERQAASSNFVLVAAVVLMIVVAVGGFFLYGLTHFSE